MLKNETKNNVHLDVRFVLVILAALVVVLLLGSRVYAAITTNLQYDSSRDEYVYTYARFAGANTIVVAYENPSNGGAYGPHSYSGSQFTGLMYLACNGNYTIELLNGNDLIKRENITTTQINTEPSACSNGTGATPDDGNDGGGDDGSGGGSDGGDGKRTEIDGGIVIDFYYLSSRDDYTVKFIPDNIARIYLAYHYEGTYNIRNEKDFIGLNFSGDFYLNCNGRYLMEFYNSSNTLLHREYFETSQINEPLCDSSANENEYIEDPTVLNPPSGGGGGGGDGGNGGGGGNGEDNPCCALFDCPGWDEHMGMLRQIRDAIPPPPNWQQVANTMRDTIVPRMIDDLGALLGNAPSPPAPPSDIDLTQPVRMGQPQDIPDYAERLNNQAPIMQDVPGLDDSGYSFDDIKNEAPEIQFREDPTGGFNIGNPLEMLPSIPSEPPIPGQGDAGEWHHEPQEPSLTTPVPEGGGEVDVIAPPMPGNNNDGRDPNENGPPIPDEGETIAPAPINNDVPMGNYKRHPDDLDGSG